MEATSFRKSEIPRYYPSFRTGATNFRKSEILRYYLSIRTGAISFRKSEIRRYYPSFRKRATRGHPGHSSKEAWVGHSVPHSSNGSLSGPPSEYLSYQYHVQKARSVDASDASHFYVRRGGWA